MASRLQSSVFQHRSYALNQSLSWTASQRIATFQEPNHTGAPSSTSSYPVLSHGNNLNNDCSSTGVSQEVSEYSAFLVDNNENFTIIPSSNTTLGASSLAPFVTFGGDFGFLPYAPSSPWDSTIPFRTPSPFSLPDPLRVSSPSSDAPSASYDSAPYSFPSPDISMTSEFMPPTPNQHSVSPVDWRENIDEEYLNTYHGPAAWDIPGEDLPLTIDPALIHPPSPVVDASPCHREHSSAPPLPPSPHSSLPLPFPQGPFDSWLLSGLHRENMSYSPAHTLQHISRQHTTVQEDIAPVRPIHVNRSSVIGYSVIGPAAATSPVDTTAPNLASGTASKPRMKHRVKRASGVAPLVSGRVDRSSKRQTKHIPETEAVFDNIEPEGPITRLLPRNFISGFLSKAVIDNVGDGITCDACEILPGVRGESREPFKTHKRHLRERHVDPIADKYRDSEGLIAPIEEAFLLAYIIVNARNNHWRDRKSTNKDTPPSNCSPQCAEEGKALLSNYEKGIVAKDATLRSRLMKLEGLRAEMHRRCYKIWGTSKCDYCHESYSRSNSLTRHLEDGTCKGMPEKPKGDQSRSDHVAGASHQQAQQLQPLPPTAPKRTKRTIQADDEEYGATKKRSANKHRRS